MTRAARPPSPLPARDGVCASCVYLPDGPWRTLSEFLHERYPHLAPDVLDARLQRGDIVDEHGQPQAETTLYRAHQWLWYYREVPDEPVLPFDLPIIYASDGLVVADKPHFMATTPGGRHLQETVLVRLRHSLGLNDLSPIHRLDRDTAGVVVFCADPSRRGAYQSLFQRREVDKEYEAVAPRRSDLSLPYNHQSCVVTGGDGFRMVECAGPANSETRIELLGMLPDGNAHYRLLPVTGRKHQLRVHLNALGTPIVHDRMYPDFLPASHSDDFSRPLQLLARAISFVDPFTGQRRTFYSQRQLALADVRSTAAA